MPKLLRHRTILVWILPAVVLAALWLTDPDKGASTGIWALRVVCAVVAAALAHWALKAEHDYPEADRRTLFGIIRDTKPEDNPGRPIGAGLALLAEAMVLLAFTLLFGGMARADTVPAAARQYLPMLVAEQHRFWPDHPAPYLMAAQIDHETACPRVRTCWQPTARLKTSREEGAGLLQLTRTFRADGSIRFDALAEIVDRHPALGELSWENVYHRPDLQLEAFVLKARDDFNVFRAVPDTGERVLFGLISHNRGTGGVQAERRACAISRGCDPGRWFANVELHCTASHAALYGSRSACDISRNYPRDILARAPKYRGLV